LCGVVSEADLIRDAFVPDPRGHLRPAEQAEQSTPTSVEEVMTPHAISVHEFTDIAEVADLMTSTGVKSLPVIDDDGRLVGVVSRSDLVKVRARADDVIESEVDARLVSMGHGDWLVSVTNGDVEIDGPSTEADRSIAQVIVSTIPGVAKVTVR
jgi:signal-transduction protein with cAMP-binding, CBS, and nucleotidyltransferase domain